APDCALFFWTSGSLNADALDIIRAWEWAYKTWAYVWIKTKPSRGAVDVEELTLDDLHTGTGYSTRANAEVVLLAKGGAPLRLSADVHQVVIAPAGDEHSEKPDEIAARIARLYPGPYLELFARKEREGWTTWGNEVPPPVRSTN